MKYQNERALAIAKFLSENPVCWHNYKIKHQK
jgi:hypothetical protein